MKTTNFISNSFGLYLFEHKNFLNIANKTSLKTVIFSLFIVNLIFSIIGNIIFGKLKHISIIEGLINTIITSTIGFLVILFLIFIFSGLIHIIYKLFKSDAKLRKIIIMVISVNIVFFILYAIFVGILYYLIKHPNLNFHKILFTLFGIFNLALIIWNFIVSFKYYGKIERISNIKSLFAYSIIFLLIYITILSFKLTSIIVYIRGVYGF